MKKLNSHELEAVNGGATAIEYGLIAALISVALISGATNLGNALGGTFTNLSGKVGGK